MLFGADLLMQASGARVANKPLARRIKK